MRKCIIESDNESQPTQNEEGLFLGAIGHFVRSKFTSNYENWFAIPNLIKYDILTRLLMVYNDIVFKYL